MIVNDTVTNSTHGLLPMRPTRNGLCTYNELVLAHISKSPSVIFKTACECIQLVVW